MVLRRNEVSLYMWVALHCLLHVAAWQGTNFGSNVRNPEVLRTKSVTTSLKASMGGFIQEDTRSITLDWSFLDGVYLITCPNADPNGERLERAKEILGSVGLSEKLEIKEFDTDDENRIRGCYTSHISVLTDIMRLTERENNGKNMLQVLFGEFFSSSSTPTATKMVEDREDLSFLVLEDNLALSSGELQQGVIDSIAQYCTKDPTWDMIHLSYIPYVPDLKVTKTEAKDIVKLSCGVGSALGTTAYIINVKAIKRLLDDDYQNGGFYAPIPDVMAKLFPESRYATSPTIFVRAPNTKSLVNPQLDDLRTLLFQPAVATFCQQVLIATGLTTNALLPITVSMLLVSSAASIISTFQSLRTLWITGAFDGPIIFPVISAVFALFSLAIIAQGIALAPKQEST